MTTSMTDLRATLLCHPWASGNGWQRIYWPSGWGGGTGGEGWGSGGDWQPMNIIVHSLHLELFILFKYTADSWWQMSVTCSSCRCDTCVTTDQRKTCDRTAGPQSKHISHMNIKHPVSRGLVLEFWTGGEILHYVMCILDLLTINWEQ